MGMNGQIDKRLLSLILSGRLTDSDWNAFSPTDWELIVHLARAEGIGPLLYWTMSRSARIQSLPAALQTSLWAMYVTTGMNNEQIIRELETLAGAFERAGIPVIALKGACFALTIYPDPGLRPMVDLDLLVPAARSAEALEIVKASGYVPVVPEASPGLDDLLSHAVGLKKTGAPYTMVELHHTLVAEGSFLHSVPVDWFWSQTEPLSAASSENKFDNLRMLTPTAQLLYACAHAMLQHGGRNTSLRWLYDLDRLVRVYAESIDWDLLLTQAKTFAWSSAVSAALSEVIKHFDTHVPQEVLTDLSKHADRNRERVAMMQSPPATHTVEELQKLRSLDWKGRLKLLMALVAPAPAYMRWRYGLKSSRDLPVWYLYRWWGILKDGLNTVGVVIRNYRFGSDLDGSPEKLIKL